MSAIYSVSALTSELKAAFADFGTVSVEGEVSQFTAHRSGHWYYTLKDRDAVLSCVMFRGNNQFMRWRPQVGDSVVVHGKLDVYGPQGRYSLIARRMEPAGAGDMQRQLEELKAKLSAEGLFDPGRKQSLPQFPRAIGVATSATGAALKDILRVIDERFSGLQIYLAPCKVQGIGAPEEICAAIELLNEHGGSDVLIVGRGGGSQEDLHCFNDESVARAIAQSVIPVVSAVGHEVDVSIADLVADVRAATPSHAAELVVVEKDQLLLWLDEQDGRLRAAMERVLRQRREHLARLVLRHPMQRVIEARRRTQELGQRLGQAMKHGQQARLSRLEGGGGRLSALSPVAVLERGYAVALHEGRTVRDPALLAPGALLTVKVQGGELDATATQLRPRTSEGGPS